MTEQTALYRLFDAGKTLLYVGISNNFGNRWHQHADVQPWWPQVDHQTVQWHSSREDALLAEKRAIQEEAPIHNVFGSPWEKHVKDDGTGFYVTPKPPPKGPGQAAGIHQIALRLPDDLHTRLSLAAKKERRSLQKEIHWLLERALDEQDAGQAEPQASK